MILPTHQIVFLLWIITIKQIIDEAHRCNIYEKQEGTKNYILAVGVKKEKIVNSEWHVAHQKFDDDFDFPCPQLKIFMRRTRRDVDIQMEIGKRVHWDRESRHQLNQSTNNASILNYLWLA